MAKRNLKELKDILFDQLIKMQSTTVEDENFDKVVKQTEAMKNTAETIVKIEKVRIDVYNEYAYGDPDAIKLIGEG